MSMSDSGLTDGTCDMEGKETYAYMHQAFYEAARGKGGGEKKKNGLCFSFSGKRKERAVKSPGTRGDAYIDRRMNGGKEGKRPFYLLLFRPEKEGEGEGPCGRGEEHYPEKKKKLIVPSSPFTSGGEKKRDRRCGGDNERLLGRVNLSKRGVKFSKKIFLFCGGKSLFSYDLIRKKKRRVETLCPGKPRLPREKKKIVKQLPSW